MNPRYDRESEHSLKRYSSYLLRVFFLLAPLAWVSSASAQLVATCAQYQSVTIGSYIVQTNYWNQTTCPGTQCVTVNSSTGAFGVTEASFSCAPNVASYPSIYYGCHFGSCSPGDQPSHAGEQPQLCDFQLELYPRQYGKLRHRLRHLVRHHHQYQRGLPGAGPS